MTGALVLGAIALLLGLAAAAQVLPEAGGRARRRAAADSAREVGPLAGWPLLAAADTRLGLSTRIARAGLAERLSATSLLAAKAGGGVAGVLWALVAAPSAPSRLAWVVAVVLPAAGFLGPDAWLEHRARRRLRALRTGLPDALDLLAVGSAAASRNTRRGPHQRSSSPSRCYWCPRSC